MPRPEAHQERQRRDVQPPPGRGVQEPADDRATEHGADHGQRQLQRSGRRVDDRTRVRREEVQVDEHRAQARADHRTRDRPQHDEQEIVAAQVLAAARSLPGRQPRVQ